MGYLLKEALKTLCGVNRWSYAVFWKIGCQNLKLLIWEEYYHEPASHSEFSGAENELSVHFLVNKMMLNYHVIVLGEGLVGRAAFTGDYQWILSENFYKQNHPPEVQKEVCQQFLGGMQTVAVIPVLPHGVIQFGSTLAVAENTEFVNHVTSLILHLGCVSGALQTENYAAAKGTAPRIGVSDCQTNDPHSSSETTNLILNSLACSQTSLMSGVVQNELLLHDSSLSRPFRHSDYRMQQPISCHNTSGSLMPKSRTDSGLIYSAAAELMMDSNDYAVLDHAMSGNSNAIFDQSTVNSFLNNGYGRELDHREDKPQLLFEGHVSPGNNNSGDDDPFARFGSGEDLFDVLGADFKNKLLSGCWNTSLGNESIPAMEDCLVNFSSTGTDSILAAMVSEFQASPMNSTDAGISCRTALTNVNSSFAPNTSLQYGQYLPKSEAMDSIIYGSQLSSWNENNQQGKQSNSVSTGHSKKPDETTTKPARKRLKPGENPRPRPKDRQMIQDRVKELREIVPNGAKCSIDALLERTIKHMLFLQSVMKHADKLKQSGESKIISKDGSLLSKGSFEGGATWAYEVGSQSSVCPVIVKDLHQPRQMLVEMFCEERGLFLEIADVIRGLGLTIVKGVMENRNDKIWARFAVEANRDITRMEIFISLVHLLEQGAKSGVAQSNDMNSKNMTAQKFHPVANPMV